MSDRFITGHRKFTPQRPFDFSYPFHVLQKLGYLPSDLIGAGKFSFEQRPPTLLDPALEPFEILDVVAQSLPERFSVHQTDVPPKLGTTRGNPSKILESSRAIGF